MVVLDTIYNFKLYKNDKESLDAYIEDLKMMCKDEEFNSDDEMDIYITEDLYKVEATYYDDTYFDTEFRIYIEYSIPTDSIRRFHIVNQDDGSDYFDLDIMELRDFSFDTLNDILYYLTNK